MIRRASRRRIRRPASETPSARRVPVGIFLAALAVRAIYLIQSQVDPLHDFPYALTDSLFYHRQAQEILAGHWVGSTAYFLGPLYGHFVAAVYALAGPSMEAVRLAQALLGAASCVLLQQLGARLFGPRAGLLAGVLLAVYGLHVYYTGLLLPTVLVLFLDLAFLALLLRALDAPSLGRAAAAGAVLGLAVLAKSNALLLLPVALALAAFRAGLGSPARRVAWCAVFAVATLGVVAPATLHNQLASGRFVLVTTATGRNLWKGNGPHANGTHPLGHREGDVAGLGRRLQGEVDAGEAVDESSSYTARTVRHALDQPGQVAKLLAVKLALFFNASELSVRDNYTFARRYAPVTGWLVAGFAWIAPLGLAGMLSAWRRRPRPLALYALFGVQLVSFVGVFVLARYRIVAVACLVLFAAHELVRWWDAARARRIRELAPGLAAAAQAAVLVNFPLPGFPRERGFALQHERIGDLYAMRGDAAAALAAYREALGADWQDLDPALKRGQTLLRMARVQAQAGDVPAARATLESLRSEPLPAGPDAERLAEDARALSAELSQRS